MRRKNIHAQRLADLQSQRAAWRQAIKSAPWAIRDFIERAHMVRKWQSLLVGSEEEVQHLRLLLGKSPTLPVVRLR
jgi:hypothetical protein